MLCAALIPLVLSNYSMSRFDLNVAIDVEDSSNATLIPLVLSNYSMFRFDLNVANDVEYSSNAILHQV